MVDGRTSRRIGVRSSPAVADLTKKKLADYLAAVFEQPVDVLGVAPLGSASAERAGKEFG
jgi:hypothetical protein